MAGDGAKTGSTKGLWLNIGGAAAVLVIGLAYWNRHPDGSFPDTPIDEGVIPAGSVDPPAPPALAAIVGDLQVGAVIGGWTVTKMVQATHDPERNGALVVFLSNGAKSFRVAIREKTLGTMPAAFETNRFLVQDGMFIDTKESEVIEPMLAIVRRLRAFEGEPNAVVQAAPVCAVSHAQPSASAPPSASAAPSASASAEPR